MSLLVRTYLLTLTGHTVQFVLSNDDLLTSSILTKRSVTNVGVGSLVACPEYIVLDVHVNQGTYQLQQHGSVAIWNHFKGLQHGIRFDSF